MNCVAMSKCCLYVKMMSISDSMFNIFDNCSRLKSMSTVLNMLKLV